MTNLLAAEARKLRTSPWFYPALAVTVVATVVPVAFGVAAAGEGDNPPLGPDSLRDAVSGIPLSLLSVVVLVLAVLAMAGEYQHQTITSTFLVTPRRQLVVAAKLVTFAAAGAALTASAAAVALAVAVPWLASEGVDVSLADAAIARRVAGMAISGALYGVLGVGVAALVPNQTGALAGALVWVMGIEGLLLAVAETFEPGLGDAIGKWLPGGAAAALAGSTRADSLSGVAGGVLFAAYGVTLAVLGARLVLRRDVT